MPFAGFIAFLIMRQLGEMVVEEPVAGSFSHFAYKYWGNFAGFASGWNYWVLYVLVAMAELTAVGYTMCSSGGRKSQPGSPRRPSSCAHQRHQPGQRESVLARWNSGLPSSKSSRVVAMILFGGYLLFSGNGGPQATVT
jgi:aromatic amino acid transport protein AroP